MWTEAVYGYSHGAGGGPTSRSTRATAPAPCRNASSRDFAPGPAATPRTPWDETVIYEAHVKGLTRLMEGGRCPRHLRRPRLGAQVIGHLEALGVTAIELLPVRRSSTTTSRPQGPRELLGLSALGLLRFRAALSRGGGVRRCSEASSTGCTGAGIQVHSRRGATTHRRIRPPRPDARLSRARQPQLL